MACETPKRRDTLNDSLPFRRDRFTTRVLLYWFLTSLAVAGPRALKAQVHSFESAASNIIESGTPSFVVIGPESMGLRTAPTFMTVLKDGRLLALAGTQIAIGDGVRWETCSLQLNEQRDGISSVIEDDQGRLYAGVGNSFSRLELRDDSLWHPVEVQRLLMEDASRPINASQSLRTQVGWFWYTGSGPVYKWEPGTLPCIVANTNSTDRIFTCGDAAYVSDRADGEVLRLTERGGVSAFLGKSTSSKRAVSAGIDLGNGTALVATRTLGLMLFDGHELKPFSTQSPLTGEYYINDLCDLSGGYYAALVERLGIVFFNRQGKVLQILSHTLDERLARTRRLLKGAEGMVWALLNDAIVRVEFPSRISHIESMTGSGVTVAMPFRYEGALWVLGDGRLQKAVYTRDGRMEGFKVDAELEDPIFSFSFAGKLLCAGTERGLLARENGKWRLAVPELVNPRILPRPPGEKCELYASKGEIGILDTSSSPWTVQRIPVKDLKDNYGALMDKDDRIWIELGAGHVGLVNTRVRPYACEIFDAASGIPESWVQIFVLDGIARFNIGDCIWRLENSTRRFSRDDAFMERYGHTTIQGRPSRDLQGRLWLAGGGTVDVINDSRPGLPAIVESNVAPGLQPFYFTFETNGAAWMHDSHHLVRYDPSLPTVRDRAPQAIITHVEQSGNRLRLKPGDPRLLSLPYKDDSLSIHFLAVSNAFRQNISFEVLLEGSSGGWVRVGNAGATVFNQLKEGSYVLRVRALNGQSPGPETSLQFRILPPWFRTPVAYTLYLCGAVGLVLIAGWSMSMLERREKTRLEKLVGLRTAELRETNAKLQSQIDETRRSEEQVRRLNEELEQRVEQRTADLNLAKEKLLESNRELEAFSYSVSHDLRAPLRNINGFGEILKKRYAASLDNMGSHYVDVLCAESLRLGRLIDSLLAFSKITRAELQKAPVNLTELAEKVKADLAQETAGREIHWTIDLLPTVDADPTLLRQVLANLFGNAVKFTRERCPAQIEFSCPPANQAPGEVVFQVKDNGIGFDGAYKDRLFGVFQRLHKQSEYEGTGIGLANVRRIISRHGGRVWAESKPGEGARFFFSLPARTPEL